MVKRAAYSVQRIAYRETCPPKFLLSAIRYPLSASPVWIEVDLEAVRHNFREVRRAVHPRVKILAVVKANAYGHGLIPVARALTEAGADALAVASVVEAVTLRQALDGLHRGQAGLDAQILVLGQFLPEEIPLVVQHQLTPSLGELAAAQALSQAACAEARGGASSGAGRCALERPVRFHLKVDTGMGRYGVWHEEAEDLCRNLMDLPGLKLEGIFTHLSMAGQSIPATEEQILRFQQLLDRLDRKQISVRLRHAANSVGIVRFPLCHWDMVRTGLLLYGVSPLKEGQPLDLKPALALKSRVRFLKTIQPGQTVSYGATFQAQRPTAVATVPVGYAHGYARALSNRADLLIRGRRARVIGRVTMEDLMADVTDLPGVQVGDEVALIGRQGEQRVTAEELARAARTIPYEILVGLSPTIPRFYSEELGARS